MIDYRAELQALYDDVTAERWDAMAHRAAIERAQSALAAPPTLTPQQQHALAAFDNLLQHCTDNTGEALIREAIMGGEA